MTPAADDRGSMLLELAISVALISAVMGSLTLFYTQSTGTVRKQAHAQAAAQYAVEAMEYVSMLPGSNVLLGRTQAAVQAQWRAPGVDAHLAPGRTQLAWSDTAPPAGLPGLPTAPDPILVGGIPTMFVRHWYVGDCWQPVAGGDCVVVPVAQRPARVRMYRVVVAVVWPSRDCGGTQCQHVAAMLTTHDQSDPTFE